MHIRMQLSTQPRRSLKQPLLNCKVSIDKKFSIALSINKKLIVS